MKTKTLFLSLVVLCFFLSSFIDVPKNEAKKIDAQLRKMEKLFAKKEMEAIAAIYAKNAYMLDPSGLNISGEEKIKEYWQNIVNPVEWKLESYIVSANEADLYKHEAYQSLKNKPPDWKNLNLDLNNVIYQLGQSTLKNQRDGKVQISVVKFILLWQKQANGEYKILVDTYAW